MRLITVAAVVLILAVVSHADDTPPGWQYGKTVSECNRYMLDHQLSTDVSFQIGPQDGARSLVRAHKYVLMSRSAVFETMLFRHQKQEQNRTTADSDVNIRIADMDPGVFKEMLNFIYTDNATVSLTNVLPLMYAGKKYQLPKLIGECQRVLQTNISVNNVCVILDQAILFEEQELINKSVVFIGRHADKVFKSEAFFNLSKAALQAVVSFDRLQIDEIAVYSACVKWARTQLKNTPEKIQNATDNMIRQSLGDVLYRIRFPTMSVFDFATLSGKSDVLSCDEKSSIYYYIGTNDDNSNSLKFDRKQRYAERSVVRYGGAVVQHWGCRNIPDAILFKTSKDIILTGIGTYGPSNQWGGVVTAITTTVDILTGTQYDFTRVGGAVAFSADYSNFTVGSQILKIALDERIEIKASTLYVVKLSILLGGMNGCYRAYGQSGMSQVLSEPSVTFTFSNAPIHEGSQTTTDTGQIPIMYYIA